MSTETAPKPYRLASGEGLADVWWKTGRITVKAGPDETANAFSQFEVDDPRGIPHAYLVRAERARMLVTISRSGSEQLFVSLGVPVTSAEPPTDTVMPPMPEMARLFAGYGAEILGPPPSLSDLS